MTTAARPCSRPFLAISAFLFLAACGPTQQQKLMEVRQQENDRVRIECTDLYDDARLNPLRGHINVSQPIKPTLAMLAGDTTPSEEEKQALVILQANAQHCREMSNAFYAKWFPRHVAAHRDYQLRSDIALAALYKKEISYGTFNLLMVESDRIKRNDFERIDASIRGETIEQRKAEALESAANAQRGQALMGLGLGIMNAGTPTVTNTNCNWLGTMLNCSSVSNR